MCVHPKTKSKLRKRLKELTSRSWNIGYERRKEVLMQAIRGWVTYFRLADMRNFLEDTDQWLRGRIRMYMEMLETDTYTFQEFAEVRHSEVASLAVGKQSQRILPSCPQLYAPCRHQRDAEACRLSLPNGLLCEIASVLRTAVCGTARTVV